MTHRLTRTASAATLTLAALLLLAPPLAAQVVGSRHDFSTGGGGMWGSTDEDQVCVFCHTPHAAGARPLWNRTNNTAPYTLYDAPVSTEEQPTGSTLLCLSCHDGVTAINDIINPSQTIPAMDPGADQIGDIYYPGSPFGYVINIGGSYPANPNVNNLSDDHPVSFAFDSVALGPAFQAPPGGDPVKLVGPALDRVECTSCHEAHDRSNPPFLVKSNAGSAICTTCHLK